MNTVTVSAFHRPFHTRLCLESICRAHRWHKWADEIIICLPAESVLSTDRQLVKECLGVIERNQDVPLVITYEPRAMNAHEASGWMLDHAFSLGAECTLYTEDDVVLAVDAFVLLDWVQTAVKTGRLSDRIIGCTLYHETIVEHYPKDKPPDDRLLHLCNGINTCGGTAFLREPYMQYLKPDWNCKQVEPKGFDYSAHYLMYRHGLYMVYPDYSRSMNCGFTAGSISQPTWAQYFGRSIWVQTPDAAKSPRRNALEWFRIDVNGPDTYPGLVREEWMVKELEYRGLL